MARNHNADNTPHNTPPDEQPPDGAAPAGYPDTQTSAIWNGELSERHRHALEVESAISPEAIKTRGYFTATNPNVLRLHGFSKAQALVPALVVPLWDMDGGRAGVAVRHTIPRTDKNGKEVKYDIPPGAGVALDVAPLTRHLITDVSVPLIITEGAKKADAAASRGLCAMNSNGVWGFLSRGIPHPDWEKLRPYLRGRVVFIAYDSDVARKRGVETAMRRLEALLKSMGAIVKVIYLSDGPNGEKTGLDDFFARGSTDAQLWLLARDLEPVEESNRKRREQEKADKRAKIKEEAVAAGVPQIEVSDRSLPDITDDLARALAARNGTAPTLFHGSTGLSHLTVDKDGGDIIKTASLELLQGVAGDAAAWISTTEKGVTSRVFPPKSVCAVFLERPERWRNIPPLENIANAPFFAPNGTLCDRNGYHAAAQTWLSLPHDFKLPDTTPTHENIEAARRLILDKALEGVAFADEASRAHAVAAMIQPAVRRMILGATPIYLFDAPVQASGKSYAARLTIAPHTTPISMNDIKNPEEWEKVLFSAFMEGRNSMYIDNITGRLDSPTLASYVTEPEKKQRILGINKTATVKTRGATWTATSNNALLSGDAVSRIVKIRLDTGLETPESRQFRGDPEKFICENRGEVFGALLTLVNAWIAAGSPPYTKQKHRFAEWSRIMGGILEVAGIPGFLDNLEAERENMAPEKDAWREFISAWFEQFGTKSVTAKELLDVALKCEGISGIIGEKDNKAKRLGDLLSRKRDQIFADLQIQKAAEKSKHGVKWCLFSRNPAKKPENLQSEAGKGDAGDAGDAGTYSPYAGENNKENQKEDFLNKNTTNSDRWDSASPASPASPVEGARQKVTV